MNRLALLLLVPLLTALTLVAPAEAATPAGYASQVHQATNKQRTGDELAALKQSRCLQKMARKQAARMAAAQVLVHQDLGPVLSTCRLRAAGENIAEGYPNGARLVNTGWMRSAGHRANILNRTFRTEGIGAVRDADGRWYVSQVFGTRR